MQIKAPKAPFTEDVLESLFHVSIRWGDNLNGTQYIDFPSEHHSTVLRSSGQTQHQFREKLREYEKKAQGDPWKCIPALRFMFSTEWKELKPDFARYKADENAAPPQFQVRNAQTQEVTEIYDYTFLA